MVELIFVTHATTTDNEVGVGSGIYDVDLSPLGEEQAKELGERFRSREFSAVYCSELRRSYKTASIAFADRNVTLLCDKRLNECDYGSFTRYPNSSIGAERVHRIQKSFPHGESYQETTKNVHDFLTDIVSRYDKQTVLVIGHRATQYGLEHLLKGKALPSVVEEEFHWQPEWRYQIPSNFL